MWIHMVNRSNQMCNVLCFFTSSPLSMTTEFSQSKLSNISTWNKARRILEVKLEKTWMVGERWRQGGREVRIQFDRHKSIFNLLACTVEHPSLFLWKKGGACYLVWCGRDRQNVEYEIIYRQMSSLKHLLNKVSVSMITYKFQDGSWHPNAQLTVLIELNSLKDFASHNWIGQSHKKRCDQ